MGLAYPLGEPTFCEEWCMASWLLRNRVSYTLLIVFQLNPLCTRWRQVPCFFPHSWWISVLSLVFVSYLSPCRWPIWDSHNLRGLHEWRVLHFLCLGLLSQCCLFCPTMFWPRPIFDAADGGIGIASTGWCALLFCRWIISESRQVFWRFLYPFLFYWLLEQSWWIWYKIHDIYD